MDVVRRQVGRKMVVCLNANALISINEVTLPRTRPVGKKCVTVFGPS